MTDKKISELPPIATLSGSAVIPAVQDGATGGTTAQAIADLATPYHADAVRFAAASYLARGGPLTGVLDSPVGTVTRWFKASSDTLDRCNLFQSTPNYNVALSDAAGIGTDHAGVFVGSADFANDASYDFGPVTPPGMFDDVWHSILTSWDVSDPNPSNWVFQYILDRQNITFLNGPPVVDGAGFDVQWVDNDFSVFGNGDEIGPREFADLWGATQFVDFTVTANIDKFVSAVNEPVFLGADGSLPTGTPPAVFLSGPAASITTNKGTGGNFSVVGDPVTNASTSPSPGAGFATAAQGALADTAVQPGDLGTAATLNVGVAANNVVQLDGSALLPAVDGSQLTNLPSPTGVSNSYAAADFAAKTFTFTNGILTSVV